MENAELRGILLGNSAAAFRVGDGGPQTPQEQYDAISNGQDRVTIETLMKRCGVTAEDMQVVANEHPEIISQIGGGSTCQRLADEASRRGGRALGQCGGGTRRIYEAAGCANDSINSPAARYARDQYRQNYPFKGRDPGADSFYIGLEASGNYVSIDVENRAYRGTKGGHEDCQMNGYLRTVQPGVTVSFDCVFDRGISQAGTAGGKWGHVAVKRNDGKFQCDGTQQSINCARYGPQIHVSFPKNASIPREYALLLIQQQQERTSDPNSQYPADVRRRKAATPTQRASRSGRSSTGNRSTTAQRRTSTRNHRGTPARRRTSTGNRGTTVRRSSSRGR